MIFFRQFQHLLPNGEAWRIALNKTLRKFFVGLGDSSEETIEFIDDVYLDLFPPTTRELEEWETTFALPAMGTDAERRIQLAARWQAQGGQSPRYLQDTMQAAGFPVFVHPWWTDAGIYTGVNFGAPQDGAPVGLEFSRSGDRMYIVGNAGDDIHEYALSTKFDIATAVDSVSPFDVSGQETNPRDVAFKGDGTKMFLTGTASGGDVFQYTLSPPWDVSSAVYDTVSFDISTEEASPHGIDFSEDGLTMFIVGDGSAGDAWQYDLTTAWDLTTGVTYSGNTLDINTQDASPRALHFTEGGLTLWILGNASTDIFKYTLTTAYDLSTATFASVSFDVGSEDTGPNGMFVFNRTFWMIGSVNDTVYEYHAVKDPNDHTNSALIGNTQCGDDGTDPDTPIAECGEQPPGQTSVLSAVCNRFLVNEVGYLVNENLTDEAPPGIPTDPAFWPYFLYWGGATFPDTVEIPTAQRDEFERLLLQICPAQQWLVTLVTFSTGGGGDFAYTFPFTFATE